MKKFIYIFCLILYYVFYSSVLADYVPVPSKYRNQYRNEINIVIKAQIAISKKEIENIFKEAQSEKNQYIKTTIVEQGINSVILELYMKLADITDKYTNIKKDIPDTDWYGDLKDIITPYLNDNNINTSELNSFLRYAHKKQLKLEKENNKFAN